MRRKGRRLTLRNRYGGDFIVCDAGDGELHGLTLQTKRHGSPGLQQLDRFYSNTLR